MELEPEEEIDADTYEKPALELVFTASSNKNNRGANIVTKQGLASSSVTAGAVVKQG